ncbi:MAG: hypothetical protein N3G22_02605 [Candidatus Micrarchaeota archaeon]|nr:hypothetical protein [Candidatus Micrarchaeota archaeon]
MRIDNVLSVKGLFFLLLFSAVVLVADSINFSKMLGAEKQHFTFFQFVGPIAGSFLGAGVGVLSVLLAQLISFIYLGKPAELFNLLRFLPMLFATFYFAKYSKGKLGQAAAPLICMALFILHPVGSQAWYYSLYWLIPLFVLLLPENLFLRSLGATFTAHSIGSTLFLYFIPSTPALWVALIPVVAFERTLFALGISASFVAFNTVLARVDALSKSPLISIDRRYVLFAKA